MKTIKRITGSLLIVVLIAFYSCRPNKPDFIIGEKFDFVEDKNGSAIRSITIAQYDTINNFIGKKYIYKNPDSEGKSRVHLFSENEGYHFNGDTIRLRQGFIYKLYIKTLGFADTLVLKP
jgi:hypothetical protein